MGSPFHAAAARRPMATAAGLAAAALLLAGMLLLGGGRLQPRHRLDAPLPAEAGWASSYLFGRKDAVLSQALDEASLASPLVTRCTGDLLQLNLTAAEAQLALLGTEGGPPAERAEELVSGIAHRLPCVQAGQQACCSRPLIFRRATTDYAAFQQVFTWHYLRFLYPLFASSPPRYVLDAGANVGFSTVLFKLLWPDATVVSLEPDASNFALLQRNIEGLQGTHALNAGLWNRRANITLTGSHGAWGRVFREAKRDEGGMPAYSVQDVADMFGIAAFDFVKIDVEGAEGVIFGSSLEWVGRVSAVLMEVHDFFAGYFGLAEVSSTVDAAFNATDYTLLADNEHLLFISPVLHKSVAEMSQW